MNIGLTNSAIEALAVGPVSTQTVYAGTWEGVFKTTNDGAVWEKRLH